jgi:hypothetical protein
VIYTFSGKFKGLGRDKGQTRRAYEGGRTHQFNDTVIPVLCTVVESLAIEL